jgi:hypothetical protein
MEEMGNRRLDITIDDVPLALHILLPHTVLRCRSNLLKHEKCKNGGYKMLIEILDGIIR